MFFGTLFWVMVDGRVFGFFWEHCLGFLGCFLETMPWVLGIGGVESK